MAQVQNTMEEKLNKVLTSYIRELVRLFAGEYGGLEETVRKRNIEILYDFANTMCFRNAPILLQDFFETTWLMFKPVQDKKECKYYEDDDYYYYCAGHLSVKNKTYHVQVYWCKPTKYCKPNEELSINVIEVE